MISQKTLVRKGAWWLNMGSFFKTMTSIPGRKNRPFFFFEGKTYTYKEVYDKSLVYAKFFDTLRKKKIAQGHSAAKDEFAVGLYMNNHPEFVFAFFGAAMSGATIFGVNTGFRGETLKNVIEQAEMSLLLTDSEYAGEVEKVLPEVKCIGSEDVMLVDKPAGSTDSKFKRVEEALDAPEVKNAKTPKPKIDNTSPLIVIYTSGTTGAPKGVPCSHIKLFGAAFISWRRIGLKSTDRGYISMPMFHSNAWYIGILPLLLVGGSFVLKPKFSASAFEPDMLEHGITYLNYVGQPIHYILVAIEKKHGDKAAIVQELANHPQNKFRIAHGNGASAIDREKLMTYLGMEHVYELYGSTEASINTTLQPGDPIDSVGLVTTKKVVVLNENDEPCPPAILDENGGIVNYEEAVGEISKKIPEDNLAFDGYYKNSEASKNKFRKGYYRSGDLGHICVVNGKRYLYFDGRTEDWIRKDGENFSSENVLQYMLKLPGVVLAAAYGAPCEVADEKVMTAIKLQQGESFDPQKAYDWLMEQQENGGMDPKWMPDYIRVVDDFELTHQTQKILTRPLKREHFNVEKVSDMHIYFRQRGDTNYRKMTLEEFENIKKEFEETGRTHLLYAGL